MKNLFFIIICISFSVTAFAQTDDDYVNEDKTTTPKQKRSIDSDATIIYGISNPDYTNHFLTPTSLTLKKGEIRLASSDIIFAKASYGITNSTTISINSALFGMFIPSIKQSVAINNELTIAASLSGGQLLAINEDSVIAFGGGSIMGTLGNIQNNFTFGAAFYYAKGTFDFANNKDELPFFHFFIGGHRQIGQRLFISFDIMYFPTYQVYTGSAGIKITIRENMSLGIGVMPIAWNDVSTNNGVEFQPILIPLLSFKILLNKGG
ncbi:MAG: hypothetical protein COA31_012605 [Flavobacteriales bacterium]|jgi:hypothetical protein|nr:hypothetical protein [Flavobacteriales bacterium]